MQELDSIILCHVVIDNREITWQCSFLKYAQPSGEISGEFLSLRYNYYYFTPEQ